MRITTRDNQKSYNVEEREFNLWKLDLLYNHSLMLKGFQFAHNDGSGRHTVSFMIAYYLVYIKTPMDVARGLGLLPKETHQACAGDWQNAYEIILDITNEPMICESFAAVPKNILDDWQKEIADAITQRFLSSDQKVIAHDGDRVGWPLVNLYMLAWLSKPSIRTEFFEKIYENIFEHVKKDKTINKQSFSKLPSVQKMLLKKSNLYIRFLVKILNYSYADDDDDRKSKS